jgi:hypothetical protein
MAASKWIRSISRVGTLLFLISSFHSVLLTPVAWADSRSQTVVFDSWVEIPGGVLPAGSYVFQLTDSSSQHQVQIYDRVSRILVATLPTVPETVPAPTEGSIVLTPRPSSFQGEAIAEWIRPGSGVGERFIYNDGMLIGEASVPANGAEPSPVNAELILTPNQSSVADTTTPVESPAQTSQTLNAAAAEQAQQQQTQPAAAQAQTAEQTPATVPSAESAPPAPESNDATTTMPKTASEVPLIAAIGACALALAGLFYLLRSKVIRTA